MIPYKANLYAFREIGVTRVIAPSAVGSLKKEIRPGDFVITDQFVNLTSRDDTFYNEMPVTHISTADPYCPQLRKMLIYMSRQLNLPVHDKGTVAVVNGPRFSTRAESELYRRNGWDIINMTQYPEVVLAREMEMCYANISLVTDYDVGVKGEIDPVSAGEVAHVFAQNIQKMKRLIFDCIPNIPDKRECECAHSLDKARF
jgi:5'-methylthioadenosine phosphorylase